MNQLPDDSDDLEPNPDGIILKIKKKPGGVKPCGA